ncbi:MAG TPA: Asp-tRNA(Asn)/Glu-tRNA(Gln) amidotransferase subunit GatA [Polyangiaceae bacterium]|nr:Asp-tRNA(Asn)/Glu-tRNA(Gln) amidotransferase subunit GatA [Polyangiaceae bacterium]
MATWPFGGVVETAERVARGEATAEQVARAALEAIGARNGELGAYVAVAGEALLEEARGLDRRRARGEALGPLAGVPIGVKDALCTRGLPTTCASRALGAGTDRPWSPPYDATVVARLRAAGALVAGKCNMDEFAMGSSTETGAYGPARHPLDGTRTAGGSSGGSAVSVAAAMTPAALGSDTGGSIRQPAAYTGVVGVKPSYGRVSRYGLVAFASSLDQVGPFASDVRGAARVLGVIAGHDPLDSTSRDAPVDDYEAACGRGVEGLTIGVPDEYFPAELGAEVAGPVRAALRALEAAGARLLPIALPHTRHALAAYYIIAPAEASSNLARFDGVRYGLREPGRDLTSLYSATRARGFGPEVRRRIMIGTYALSAGYYDAYYLKAQKVRTLIRRDFEAAFREVDLIAAPTTPSLPFRLGEKLDDPITMYLNDVFTLPASLAGIAALSVPVGRAPGALPLPVGLQLMAPALGEATLFRAAGACEAALAAGAA